MSAAEGFVDGMRRVARRGFRRSAIIQGFLALVVIGYGSAFGAICEDCNARPWMGWLFGVCIAAAGLAWGVFILRGVLKRRTPEGNPLNLQFAPYGDPIAVAEQIDREFAGETFRPRHVHVARSWVCFSFKAHVMVRRVDALVWAYIETVKHRWNGIPVGTTTQLMVWSRDRRSAAMPLKKQAAEQALLELRAAAPWMPCGYSEAMNQTWNDDSAEFIALVDESRVKSVADLK
jgi:hypothetical protein